MPENQQRIVACIWCGNPIDFVTAEAIYPDQDELTCFHDPGSTKRHEDILRIIRSCAHTHLTNLKEMRALELGSGWQDQWDRQVEAFKRDREHIHELMVLVQISKEIEQNFPAAEACQDEVFNEKDDD